MTAKTQFGYLHVVGENPIIPTLSIKKTDIPQKIIVFFHHFIDNIFHWIFILVPPNILDESTSSDLVVREGANVTLKCRAQGSPPPSIRWKRDDNQKISINKTLIGE